MILAGCSSDNDSTPGSNRSSRSSPATSRSSPTRPARAATFAVETTIPVACAVIYGTDDSFGSIAVDNDMQGGAHHDHGPLLTGLTPDTEYQYILQGSDAAGTIYRSDTLTLPHATRDRQRASDPTSPPAARSPPPARSSPTPSPPTNAIDGDLGTEWSTDGDGDDAWIEIDLGQTPTSPPSPSGPAR